MIKASTNAVLMEIIIAVLAIRDCDGVRIYMHRGVQLRDSKYRIQSSERGISGRLVSDRQREGKRKRVGAPPRTRIRKG